MFLSKRNSLIKKTAFVIACLFVNLQLVQYPVKSALADDVGSKVAIFVFPKTSKDAQPAMMLQGLLRNQIKRIGNAQCANTSPVQNLSGLIELPSLLNEGKQRLVSDNPSAAEFTFRRAVQIAEAALGGVSREVLARIYKGLGISLIFAGDTVRGKQMINRSLLLYKNQDALQYNYRVDVRNAFEQVLADIEGKATGTLTISSTPTGAEVYLADEFKGFSPITLTNLAAGEHLIKVQKDGFYNFAKFIEVSEGTSAAYEVVLTPTLDKKSFDEYLSKIGKEAGRGKKSTELILMREMTGATDVIALEASFHKGAFNLKGVHLRGDELNPVSLILKQDAAILDNCRSFLATTLHREVIAEAKDQPLDPPILTEIHAGYIPTGEEGEFMIDPTSPLFKDTERAVEKEPLYKKWWFWTLVGGVVVGGTTAIVLMSGAETGTVVPSGDLKINLHSVK